MLRRFIQHISGVHSPALLYAVVLAVSTGFAGPPTVKVEPAGATNVDARPGEVVTLVFRVTNLEGSERSYSSLVAVPVGWQLVAPRPHFAVPARDADVRYVSIHVPRNAAAGVHTVTYTAQEVASPTNSDHTTITIAVATFASLKVQILETPRFMMAGQRGEVYGIVENRGNVDVSAAVAAHVSADLALDVDSVILSLPPQSVLPFSFPITARHDLGVHTNSRIHVAASSGKEPGSTTKASAVVELFPKSGRFDSGNKPALLTLSGVGDERGTAGQVRFAGGGPFAGGQLDLEATGPDLQRTSVYGLRSVYSARYKSDRLDVLLGDNVYALSPLTEVGRFGFGAGSRSRVGRFELSGFAHKVRYSFPDDQQAALAAYFHTSSSTSIGANLLRRRGIYRGEVYTIRTSYRKDNTDVADVECGVDSNNGIRSPSCNLAVSGRWSWLSFNARALKTQPDFPGYTSDLSSVSAGVVARATPWIRVEGAAQRYDRGLDGGFSRQYSVVRVGSVLSGRPDTLPARLFLYFQHRDLTYSSLGDVTSNSQDAVKLRGGYDWKRVGLSVGSEGGWTSSVTGKKAFQRSELEVRFFPRTTHKMTASVEYASGLSDFWSGSQRQWLMNASFNIQVRGRTRGLIHLFSSLDRGERRHSYVSGRVQLNHEFGSGHLFGLKVQHGRFVGLGQHTSTDFSVSYSIPIGIPNRLRSNRQKVTGRVFDLETGEGVTGVLIFAGSDATVTGKNGVFDMSLPVGATTYLRMDRVSAGISRIPVRLMPVEITGAGGEDREINIPLARAGEVKGKVVYAADETSYDAGDVSDRYASGFLLEMSNDARRFRVLTDRDGRFAFAEVPPGPWKLSVIHARLPARYRLDKEMVPVDVTAGAVTVVDFDVVRSKRTLRLIDSGTVQLSTNSDASRRSEIAESGGNEVEVRSASADSDQEVQLKAPVEHVVQEGESLWRIARRYYRRGSLWPLIYSENRDVIGDPEFVRAGTTLRIPEADQQDSVSVRTNGQDGPSVATAAEPPTSTSSASAESRSDGLR